MLQLVAVDCGRSNVKTVTEGRREVWPAALGPFRKLKLERDMGLNDMIVEHAGEQFFVGQIAKDEAVSGAQMMLASKAHPDTKVLILTALHRAVPDGADVFLVTGSPIDLRDEDEKMKFKRMLVGTKEITVNGVTKKMNILRVGVSPECAVAAWSLRRPGTYTVVDPGSRTVNYATIRNGKYWDEKSGTLDYGVETVELTRSHFARMVVADLTRKLRTLPPITLIGGAAEAMAEPFQEWIDGVDVHPDPLYANAQAFYEMGVSARAKAQRT